MVCGVGRVHEEEFVRVVVGGSGAVLVPGLGLEVVLVGLDGEEAGGGRGEGEERQD